MEKKLKSEECGYNYFEDLPDELVILIFTKLSSSKHYATIDNIKSLGRSSLVSKRFNALIFLVPTLTIHDITIPTLYDNCPKILKKFKHIRSLRVGHVLSPTHNMLNMLDLPDDEHPIVYWEAIVDEPSKFYVAVVTCTHAAMYEDPQCLQSLILASDSANKEFMELTSDYSKTLFNFYHMLISSIKDHKFLQRVVIADLVHSLCKLTLDEDLLVKLRNRGSTDLEKVEGHMKTGCVANMDIPVKGNVSTGIMMNNVCFSIIKKWEKSKDDDDDDQKDDGDFKVTDRNMLTIALYKMLENPASVKVDDKAVLCNLSFVKSHGNLV